MDGSKPIISIWAGWVTDISRKIDLEFSVVRLQGLNTLMPTKRTSKLVEGSTLCILLIVHVRWYKRTERLPCHPQIC